MRSGDYPEACTKFEASQALDPGVGTLLNLADCYEKAGRTASAWAQFRETISAARKAGSADRERIARERVRRLEPRLSYLTIDAWKGQSATIMRDGVTIEPAVLGTAIPVDPGRHEITARASGKRPFITHVEVEDHAARVSVTIPILVDEPTAAPLSPLRRDEADAAHVPGPQLRADTSTGSTQRTLALVTAALGVAGIATGTVFGIKAASTWSDAKANCDPYPNCSRGPKLSKEAEQSATISTIGFVTGGVGVATFALLWLTAPSPPNDETPLSFAFGPLAVSVQGTL